MERRIGVMLLLSSLLISMLSVSQSSKKQNSVGRKEDIPFIKCQVYQKLANQLYQEREYARYKQVKGWKHLIVYKSGIHGLGLYTSQFISRGAMVVEYVGEVVGLHVADKREAEYQSGRKLQYKSACYFFRIDKEHIIDATCKGGIARFVNHSCLPNCVAKVISLRNEKKVHAHVCGFSVHYNQETSQLCAKVVFFAERDINPGEEITYDYHFNHEDEAFGVVKGL